MGWLLVPFHNDGTHMTAAIAAFAGVGALAAIFTRKHVPEWADSCMVLGLLGTVAGIVIATRAGTERVDIAGVGTALYTTLIGGIAYLWLRIVLAVMGNGR